MKKFSMKRCISTYNRIMLAVGWEHKTIGTRYSEGTEDFNLVDMVAECEYVLSLYHDCDCERHKMIHDPYERKFYYSETARLKRFIKNYKPYIFCTK